MKFFLHRPTPNYFIICTFCSGSCHGNAEVLFLSLSLLEAIHNTNFRSEALKRSQCCLCVCAWPSINSVNQLDNSDETGIWTSCHARIKPRVFWLRAAGNNMLSSQTSEVGAILVPLSTETWNYAKLPRVEKCETFVKVFFFFLWRLINDVDIPIDASQAQMLYDEWFICHYNKYGGNAEL